jgi:hypothetical protein
MAFYDGVNKISHTIMYILLLITLLPVYVGVLEWCLEPVIEWYVDLYRDFPYLPDEPDICGCLRFSFLYFVYVIIRWSINNDKRRHIE